MNSIIETQLSEFDYKSKYFDLKEDALSFLMNTPNVVLDTYISHGMYSPEPLTIFYYVKRQVPKVG